MVAHTYNPRTLKAEAGRSPESSKPARIAQQDPPSQEKKKKCLPVGKASSWQFHQECESVLCALLINAASKVHSICTVLLNPNTGQWETLSF